ncbi:MAG: diacylglycerol kinase family lipid kinase [Eubacteriales bacterium]|nr:diacylglycerol kinase family lipid kinase [Eubacteriales bacterium]
MFHIIVNPASRSGRAPSVWEEAKPLFDRCGEEYKVYFSKQTGHVRELCRRLTEDGSEIKLVIFGGDGTVNEAVNGIRDLSRVRLGYVPTGSSNDLARDLALPADRGELLRSILAGEVVRRIDLGELEYHNESSVLGWMHADPHSHTRRFTVSAGIGFDASVCEGAMVSPFKKVLNRVHLGKLIYLWEAIRLILTQEMVPATVTMEQEGVPVQTWQFKRLLFTAVMNHRFEGGGFRFCPHASDSDGALDLCAAADLNRLMFFRIFPTAYSGNHLRFHGIHEGRAFNVRIQTQIPLWVHTDGEVTRKSSDISIRCLPGCLQLMF